MKTYSIIIPHYNNISGLKRLLESIYKTQKTDKDFCSFLKNLYVYIIDDNSNFEIKQELSLLQNKYPIVLLENNSNRSAGACRNLGIKKLNTDFVIFSDSDDFFTPDYFKILLAYDNIDVDILYFLPDSVFDKNLQKKAERHIKYEKKILNYLSNKKNNQEIKYTWNAPWSKRIKASFIKKHNIFFDQTLASNDLMFSTRTGYYAESIDVSKETIYVTTQREGSLDDSCNHELLKSRLQVGLNYHKFCKQVNYCNHPDNCYCHLIRYIKKYPSHGLKALTLAKKTGLFEEKRYALITILKFLLNHIFSKLSF